MRVGTATWCVGEGASVGGVASEWLMVSGTRGERSGCERELLTMRCSARERVTPS